MGFHSQIPLKNYHEKSKECSYLRVCFAYNSIKNVDCQLLEIDSILLGKYSPVYYIRNLPLVVEKVFKNKMKETCIYILYIFSKPCLYFLFASHILSATKNSILRFLRLIFCCICLDAGVYSVATWNKLLLLVLNNKCEKNRNFLF